jgi:hypothetical protein
MAASRPWLVVPLKKLLPWQPPRWMCVRDDGMGELDASRAEHDRRHDCDVIHRVHAAAARHAKWLNRNDRRQSARVRGCAP